MSNALKPEILTLVKQRWDLAEQIEELDKKLESLILAEARFKPGDVVAVVAPAYPHPFEKGRIIPENRRVGRVRSLSANTRTGSVEYEIAPRTKTGFHATAILHHSSAELIEAATESEGGR